MPKNNFRKYFKLEILFFENNTSQYENFNSRDSLSTRHGPHTSRRPTLVHAAARTPLWLLNNNTRGTKCVWPAAFMHTLKRAWMQRDAHYVTDHCLLYTGSGLTHAGVGERCCLLQGWKDGCGRCQDTHEQSDLWRQLQHSFAQPADSGVAIYMSRSIRNISPLWVRNIILEIKTFSRVSILMTAQHVRHEHDNDMMMTELSA